MPRSKNRKSAKKNQLSAQTLTIQRPSEEPFFDTREEIKAFGRDMRSGLEITELRAALRIWEGAPWYVFLIQHEDAEIRQRTGTHEPIDMCDSSGINIGKSLPPYDGLNKYLSAQHELLDAIKAASTSLMRIASNRKIDPEPIALASQVLIKVYLNGSLNNLPYQKTRWPEFVELLDLDDREQKEINLGQMQIERIREEVFFHTKANQQTYPQPDPFAEPRRLAKDMSATRRKIIESVCDRGGAMPLFELAS